MYAASRPPARLCSRVVCIRLWGVTNTHTHQGQSPEGQAELAIGAEVRLTRLLQQAELNGTVYMNMY